MEKNELEMLLKEHGKSLSAFCFTIGGSSETADEIFQEVCLKLMKSDIPFRGESSTTTFLYKTALNVFRDMYRKNKRRAEAVFEESDVSEYVASIPGNGEAQEEYEALHRAIVGLPLKYREVIHLVYFRGVPGSEVAQILGVPSGTVKSRLHKAKELLKKELEK